MYSYYVYIITNKFNNVLYIGVTKDLIRRIYEHKNKLINDFSSRYNCKKLIWYEETNDIISAITKKKQMKKWKREYKINLITDNNPRCDDLYAFLIE